jgi:hypothetical protein
MTFGLSPNEVGMIEDVNRSTADNQSTTVFRKTTKPLMEMIAKCINRRLLVHMEAYARVNGELEYVWLYDHPGIQDRERLQQKEDLELGLSTLNEVRLDRGLEEIPWGDMPLELFRTLSRQQSRWALEQWLEMDEEDLPPEGGFGGLLGLSAPTLDAPRFMDTYAASPEEVRDALRNEPGYRYPALTGIARALQTAVKNVYEDLRVDTLEALQQTGAQKGLAFDVARIVAGVSISNRLVGVVMEHAMAAMTEAACFHASRLEDHVNDALPEDAPELEFEFSLQDTRALEALRANAAIRMRGVEDAVKQRIRDALVGVVESGGTVQDATRALNDSFDFLTTAHASLIARTEILDAARSGSQALAESTPLIAGKRWRATGGKSGDGRTRAWHAAMHDVVVPKDQAFTVPQLDAPGQPRNYPRTAFKVGDDQPFYCRCDQEPVLRDEMPDDIQTLYATPGIRRKHEPDMTTCTTERQRLALWCHGLPGEAFPAFIHRFDAATGNRALVADRLGVSRATLYAWLGTSP